MEMKPKTENSGIYSDMSSITGTCLVQHRNREVKMKNTSENRQTKSSGGETSKEEPATSEKKPEDQCKKPIPQTSAGRVPKRVFSESQNPGVSLLAACAGIVTLASIISVVTLYLIMRLGMQTEVKDIVGISTYKGPVQVAFAASLRKSVQTTLGPYPDLHILVYKNVFTNIGGAYNRSTGIFTAPVGGVYHFFFNAFGWGEKVACGVLLHLNNRYVTGNYDNNPGPGRAATNMISLELDVGDFLYLGLSKGRLLHVSRENYNIFCGWLVFHT